MAHDGAASAPVAALGVSTAIHIRALCKRFRRHAVLNALDLEVGAGESFALVGVNGAGKTTCIKALLDFCAIDGGHIELFGVPHREPRARARLAYLPERFLPPYYLTGRDFLACMARLYGVSWSEQRVAAALTALDLDSDALPRPVRQFSKGMAQKLGLAACFLSGRDLFVLDEPTSGLDPKARLLVKQRLAELRAEGHTIFFSTHMLADVEELCDRMGILHAGRLRFAGTPAECRARYATENLEQAYLACISGDA